MADAKDFVEPKFPVCSVVAALASKSTWEDHEKVDVADRESENHPGVPLCFLPKATRIYDGSGVTGPSTLLHLSPTAIISTSRLFVLPGLKSPPSFLLKIE